MSNNFVADQIQQNKTGYALEKIVRMIYIGWSKRCMARVVHVWYTSLCVSILSASSRLGSHQHRTLTALHKTYSMKREGHGDWVISSVYAQF